MPRRDNCSLLKWLALTALCGAVATAKAQTAFGYTDNGVSWVISTGAGLTVKMTKANCDITSIVYRNQELQVAKNGTYIDSGLQWDGDRKVTTSIANFTDGKNSIQVTCSLTGLTHYVFFRANENTLYMGTYHGPELGGPELRFLALLSPTLLNNVPKAAIMWDGTPIEAEDIVTYQGETRSKYYSAVPFIDDKYHGATGSAGGAFLIMPEHAYEGSSGGPFFRDINLNLRWNRTEITWEMRSDHSRTEDYRLGFHGPYALAFTDGSAPSGQDYSFFQRRTLTGFVKEVDRGQLTGTISDPNKVLSGTGARVVVHWFNADAQYWTIAGSGLTYTSPTMKPGTYTVVIYRKELEVGRSTVTVSKGAKTTSNLAVTYVETKPIWRIGQWDGTPEGFLNADKIYTMHPSDSRMAAWKPVDFTIGSSQDSQFPMALFRGINDPIRILFSLTASQAGSAHTLRIGSTVEFYSARPSVVVNSNWNAPVPVSHTLATRSLTRGVTHGNYFVYEFSVPASTFKTGQNVVQLGISSGKTDSTGFLHASLAFDALELV